MSSQVNRRPGRVTANSESGLGNEVTASRLKRSRTKRAISPPQRSTSVSTTCATLFPITQPPRAYPRAPNAEPRVKVASDLKHLLKHKTYSDVVLVAGDKKFEAHRAILAARSPYFASELWAKRLQQQQHQQMAKPLNVLVLDMRADVFEPVLGFIYSGEIAEGVDAKLLFHAAIQLSLPDLLELAVKSLATQLNVNNVIDVLVLAHEHKAHDLKLQAMQFFNRNAAQLIKTDGYKILVGSHLALIEELYRNSHGVVHV